MAEKIVSPGVFTKEIDASFLPAAVGDIGAAVVGPTVKGPALVPTVVNSYSEFQEKFGDVFISGSNQYTYLTSMTAKEYLRNAGKLTVVRILDGEYSGATSDVTDSDSTSATGGAAASGSIVIVGDPFTAVDSDIFKITVAGTAYNFIAASGSGNADVNLPPDSGNNFYFSSASSAATIVDNLVAKIDAASIGVDANDGGAELITFTASNAGTAGNSITVQTGSNDTELGETLLTLAGGVATTGGTGVSFKLHTLADGAILNNKETSSGINNILTSGSKDNLRWEIASKNDSKGTFTLLVRRGDDTHKSKQILETWNNLSLDPAEPNYISKMLGDSVTNIVGRGGSDPFLQMSGSFPNKSKYVRVSSVKDTITYLNVNGTIRTNAASASLPALGSGSYNGGFENGTNGVAGFDALGNIVATGGVSTAYNFYEKISSANSQGFLLDSTTTAKGGKSYMDALNLLSNADEYDINLLLLPGIVDSIGTGHAGIITKAIDVAENRGDCFVIYDAVDYDTTNITTVTTKVAERDSNYAATYWPWVQTTDNGQMRWVPPSTVLSGIYSFNDKIAAPWFAPAGLNRGGLDTVIQASRKLTHSNRDDLYESNVNPIATFPGQGVCVWGQKTLQKKSSALDRVNVRRLMIKVKKFIAASSRFLVFEQNTAQTRERFLNIANPYLEQVQSQSGLSAFRVVMDESNNTPDIVDRNILYGQIFLQPTRTAEFIVLDFTIQPTGAAFPE